MCRKRSDVRLVQHPGRAAACLARGRDCDLSGVWRQESREVLRVRLVWSAICVEQWPTAHHRVASTQHLLLSALIGAVAALAVLNNGRALPPVRAGRCQHQHGGLDGRADARRHAAGDTANQPTQTPAPQAVEGGTEAAPATDFSRRPPNRPHAVNCKSRGLPTPAVWASRSSQPGPAGGARARTPREGTRVLLTGNDQTVAARPWREIETEDHNLKGWVQGDFLQLLQATP